MNHPSTPSQLLTGFQRNSRLLHSGVCGALLISALAGNALGQIELPPVYRWDMTDLDQRRDGLVGNGGMHCVPTSIANLLSYLARNGKIGATTGTLNAMFPGVPNPAQVSGSSYTNATENIRLLGMLMNTTAADGTNGEGLKDGLRFWPNLPLYTFSSRYGSSANPSQMYFDFKSGALVAFCYGRYERIGGSDYVRNGGHCVTLQGVENYYFPAQPSNQRVRLRYRDPATDEGNTSQRLFQQSPFATTELEVLRRTDAGLDGFEMLTDNNDGRVRLIDGMTTIYPWLLFTLPPVANGIVITPTFTFNELPPQSTTVPLPNVIEVAQGLGATDLFALKPTTVAGAGAVQVSLIDAAQADITHTATIVGSSGKLAPGRKGQVYVVVDRTLRCLAPGRVAGTLVDGPTPVPLPGTGVLNAMTFDDRLDKVVALLGDGSVRTYTESLAPSDNFTLSPNPTFNTGAKPRIFAVQSATGGQSFWIGPLTGNVMRRYESDPGVPSRMSAVQTISPPAGATITDFQPTDVDSFIINRGGILQELKQDSNGRWLPDTNSLLHNMNLGSASFALSRSRTNFDPALHNIPGWRINLLDGDPLGRETLDCKADVGRRGGLVGPDGQLDNNDFTVFVALFFEANPLADLGRQGGLLGSDERFDNNDFTAFVTEFFAPCGG